MSLGILLLSFLCLLFLWNQTILLAVLLIAIAYAKHRIMPIQKELMWYCLILFGGGLTEIVLVNVGQAWSYTNAQIFGIPLAMPLLWGLLGTTLVSMYEGLVKQLEKLTFLS